MDNIDSNARIKIQQQSSEVLTEDSCTAEQPVTMEDNDEDDQSAEFDPFHDMLAVIRAKLSKPLPDDPMPVQPKTEMTSRMSDDVQQTPTVPASARAAKSSSYADIPGSGQIAASSPPAAPTFFGGGEMTLASEMQRLVQSENERDATALYKRRRIASSELLVNTRYYMTRQDSTVGSAPGEDFISFSASLSHNRPKSKLISSDQTHQPFNNNDNNNNDNNDNNNNSDFDLISSLASYSVLAVEFIKYLHPRDILTVYSISRVFHANWEANEHYLCRILACHLDPTVARAYPWELYRDFLIRNPRGYMAIDYTQPDFRRGIDIDNPTPWGSMVLSRDGTASHAPLQLSPDSKLCLGLAWVNMLFRRERQARDIVASLARKGHRVPASTRSTIRKLWTVTDCPLNRGRCGLARAWSDEDLLNAQLFFLKLDLVFNDALQGPGTPDLRRLMLGQPGGVRVLWQLLRRRRFVAEIVDLLRLQLLFDEGAVTASQRERGLPILGLPVELLGIASREGWGRGGAPLVQPDELVAAESVRRRLGVERLLVPMTAWGCVDFETGQNLVPSVQELYMSDDDGDGDSRGGDGGIKGPMPPPGGLDALAGSVMLEKGDWRPHHAMRAIFDMLSPEQQQAVVAAEEDEELIAQAWGADGFDMEVDGSEVDSEEVNDDDNMPDVD